MQSCIIEDHRSILFLYLLLRPIYEKQHENNYFCCNCGVESGNRSELNSWQRQRPGIISWCHAPSKIVDCDPMMRGKSDGTLKPSSPPISKHQKAKKLCNLLAVTGDKNFATFPRIPRTSLRLAWDELRACLLLFFCVIINFRQQKSWGGIKRIHFRWTFQLQFETNLSSSDINECVFSC